MEYPKKVRCIKAVTSFYTEGKIYDVDPSGRIIDNYGDPTPHVYNTTTLNPDGDRFPMNSDFELVDEIELDMPMTTNEVRLDYAKKTYTPGTKFISPENGRTYEVANFITIKTPIYEGLEGRILTRTDSTGHGEFIYFNGKWAEIIKEAIQEEKVMETQKLSREGLKEIHSVACPNWKDVLEHYGTRNPLENYIELTQIEVDKMFVACTKEQLPIVSKYLKQDDGSVDLSKCTIRDRHFVDNLDFCTILAIRESGPYMNKAFFLSDDYNWETKEDVYGVLCLIPTKKK